MSSKSALSYQSREPLLPTYSTASSIGQDVVLAVGVDPLLSAVRKASRQILPALFLMNLFCYVDRTSLSYSFLKPTFVNRVGLSPAAFGFGSGLFYASYVLAQPLVGYYL